MQKEKFKRDWNVRPLMNFGFLIFPGLEKLDLIGPWEMIPLWSKVTQGPEKCLMVAENPGPIIGKLRT